MTRPRPHWLRRPIAELRRPQGWFEPWPWCLLGVYVVFNLSMIAGLKLQEWLGVLDALGLR